MMRLILVRHGQTVLNVEHRYQGQIDVPLDEIGQKQARRLAGRLQHEPLARIIAADLTRAMQTAQAVAEPHGLPVEADPRLREMAFGEWEGFTFDEVKARWPTQVAEWLRDPLNVAPPGGETGAQVAGRVRSFVDDLLRTENGQTVLIVSHGGPLRIWLCLALGLSPADHWHFNLDLASISHLAVYDGQTILTILNDTHHCKDIKTEGLWEI